MASDREKRASVAEIYQKAGHLLETANEMQVRVEVIDPILGVLDHQFLADEPLSTDKTPDYTFFRDVKSKQRKDTRGIIAVGDAKEPGKNFDRTSGERSPVMQVYDYMIDSGSRWGILTDGRRWRLLNRDSSSDSHLEVDLYEIVRKDSSDDWIFFYNLFRRDAFVAGPDGRCFLDLVKEENTKYGQEIGEELKDRVYNALRELAQGFASWPENRMDARSPEARELIRESCFLLLYRLLFIFYAEARGLLPKDAEGYRQLSLETVRERVAGASRDGTQFLLDSRRIWSGLRDLFRLIDHGNQDLGIAPYNGGLFSKRGPGTQAGGGVPEHWDIADHHLARAIDFMGTAPSLRSPGELVNVDYQGLQIRHLGSLYEGLLEYKLGFAETDLVALRGKTGEVWTPVTEVPAKFKIKKLPDERKAKAGSLYLETERHERKVSGSYYTPDYVVKYIVRNTVGVVAKEKRSKAKADSHRQADAVLSVKVCDPAMGSGHFLVEATEFLADQLLQALADDHAAGLSNVVDYTIERARRDVVSHCIYGVDLNPLAVELAKVSLWLSTVSRDKPLSFLDHRLKRGNSLIGAKLIELRQYPSLVLRNPTRAGAPHLEAFIPPYYVDTLVSEIREIESLGEDTLEATRVKAEQYNQFRLTEAYKRTKACADSWTAIHFGIRPPGSDPAARYYDVLSVIDRADSQWLERTRAPWFKLAIREAAERGFFHWELEFPDILLGNEPPGFDVVLGNPPYVRIYRGQLERSDVQYFFSRFESAHKKFDLYVLFMELALNLTRTGGLWGFIVPDKFLFTPYGEKLRSLLLDFTIVEVADLRSMAVFDEATVSNVIPLIRKRAPPENHKIRVLQSLTPAELSGLGSLSALTVEQSRFRDTTEKAFRLDLTPESSSLTGKIERLSFPLEDLCYVNWGLRTGTSEKTTQMIVPLQVSTQHKPMLWGDDITDRYSLRPASWYVDYDPVRLYNPMFPELFEGEKIVVRKISGSRGLMCALDRRDCYCFSTIIVAKPQATVPSRKRTRNEVEPELAKLSLSYVTAVLNSRLMAYYYQVTLSDRLGVVPNHVKLLPIRRITSSGKLGASLPPDACERFLRDWLESEARTGEKAAAFVDGHSVLGGDEAIHDFLAFLADWMKTSYDSIHSETSGFLSWLATELKCDVTKLSGRSVIDRYYANSFDKIIDLLRKNRGKLAVDPRRRDVQERLRGEFEQSRVKVKSILERIGSVDILIDHLVYRLYDLLKPEIATIENVRDMVSHH